MLTPGQSRRNALYHTLDGVSFFMGLTLFNRATVIPAFINELTGSNLVIGLVPCVYWIGFALPLFISAKKFEGLAYKKRTLLKLAAFQRVAWLALFAWLFFAWKTPLTLVVLFLVLIVVSVNTGLMNPVWVDWYAKTMDERIWARVLGLRWAISGLVGILLGLFIRWVLSELPHPRGYQALILLAFIGYLLSWIFVSRVREERQEGLPHHRDVRWGHYLKGLSDLVSRPGAFRRYLAACICLFVPTELMFAFLAKYGLTSPAATEGITGAFTAFTQGSIAAGALAGGYLSDRRHVVAPFRLSPLLFFGAVALALVSSHPITVCAAFSLLGASLAMNLSSSLPALFRFAAPNRIPSYSAVLVMCLSIPRALSPLLVGWLIDRGILTYPTLFALCGAVAFAGWIIFLTLKPPVVASEASN
nr:hypothetical protein [Planctomycetota bacterium]